MKTEKNKSDIESENSDSSKQENIQENNKVKQIEFNNKDLKIKTSISKNRYLKLVTKVKTKLIVSFCLDVALIFLLTLSVFYKNNLIVVIEALFVILISIYLFKIHKEYRLILKKINLYDTILSINKLKDLHIEKLYESNNYYIVLYTYEESVDIITLNKEDTELYNTENNIILNFK